MAKVKITVAVLAEQLEGIRALVSAGETPTVSAFVQHAIRNALADRAG